MKKILIIAKKYRQNNPIFSDSASIIDLPSQVSEVLINNDMTIFKAISWCMFPIIWAGDILKIEPIKPQEASIGDIVLYKSEGFAFAHRLIKIYKRENDRLYILTTGERGFRNKQLNNYADNSFDNGSGVPLDNILGRVREIKRGKLCFRPDEANESLWGLIQGRLRLLLWILKRKVKGYIARIFIKLQKVKLYRYCIRSLVDNKASFLVGAQLIKNIKEVNNFRFYQTLEDFLKNSANSNSEGLYNISARINKKPVGNINLFLESIDNRKVCTLSDFRVRIPFRGGGIGCQLLEKTLYLCDKINAEEIRIEVSEENKIAINFFKKMGFEIR